MKIIARIENLNKEEEETSGRRETILLKSRGIPFAFMGA